MRREWELEDLIDCWTLVEEDAKLLASKSGATRLAFALAQRFSSWNSTVRPDQAYAAKSTGSTLSTLPGGANSSATPDAPPSGRTSPPGAKPWPRSASLFTDAPEKLVIAWRSRAADVPLGLRQGAGSTFRSARTLIRCTSAISRSTRPSVSSARDLAQRGQQRQLHRMVPSIVGQHQHVIVPIGDIKGLHPVPSATLCTSSYRCFYPPGTPWTRLSRSSTCTRLIMGPGRSRVLGLRLGRRNPGGDGAELGAGDRLGRGLHPAGTPGLTQFSRRT